MFDLYRFVYVGDNSGQITVLKLDASGVQFINVLKGQSGSIQCLCWDGDAGWLFSGEALGCFFCVPVLSICGLTGLFSPSPPAY